MTIKESSDDSIDHIGWWLWRAAMAWKTQFAEEMVQAGHDWYAEARSSVVPFIGPRGTRQAELVRRIGLTKQAVQQLVDDLEREGVVVRRPDPNDQRAKIVVFTEKGMAARRDAQRIKLAIESEWRERLGSTDFRELERLLRKIDTD
ncbi:MAG: MarR family winged helix-turn-helix transcriptional regulator [Pseudomonadota bacterium]